MAIKYTLTALLSGVAGLLAYLASDTYGADNVAPRTVLAVAFSIFFLIFLISILSEELSLLIFVFALYHLFFLVLPGMVHLAWNVFPFYQVSFPESTSLPVAFLILTYAMSSLIGIGFALSRRQILPRSGRNPTKDARNKDLMVGALALLALSIPCIVAGGLLSGELFERRADAVSAGDPTPLDLILNSLPGSGMFVCAILAFYLVRRNSFFSIVFFTLTGTLAFVLNYPLSTTRFILFQRLIVILYISLDLSRFRLKRYIALAGVVSIFTVFPVLDFFSRGDLSKGLQIEPLQYMAESGDLDGLQSTLNVYEMVQKRGLSWGYQLLGTVFSYVPRALWPGKPYSTGTSAAVSADYEFTNLSAPLISEIYVDFGALGVAIIPFFLGWGLVWVDRRAAALGRQRGHIVAKLFVGGLIGYETILLRGSLISIVSQVYLYCGLIGLLAVLCPARPQKLVPVRPLSANGAAASRRLGKTLTE